MQGRFGLGAHYETGTQRVSLGTELEFGMVAAKEDRPLFDTVAIAGRYARQLGASPAWRGFARGSLGGGRCQVWSCGAEQRAGFTPHTTATLSLGAEHRLYREPDGVIGLWLDLGVIYSHADDAMRGASDFVGLALGVRLDLDMIAIAQTRPQ